MTKITWLDINSSYSHSSLALPAIEAQQPDRADIEWSVVSGTINSVISNIIEELLEKNPDIIAYTAWLFNHEVVLKILARYKQLNPKTIIIGGGPEYLGNNKEFLIKNDFIDFLVRGEGEIAFYQWLDGNISGDGICYLKDGEYVDNGIAKAKDFSSLHYPEESRFFKWDKPFIQIESCRGCFNSCAFCVSGADKPVRVLQIDKIRERLNIAVEKGIKEIRLLDRTFNGKSRRAIEMLDLFEEYKGRLRFHLEIHPALLEGEIRERIAAMPDGLLHLEAGVQSLYQEVVDAATRYGSSEKTINGLKFIASLDNMELHSDLIAGLPLYTLDMIYQDVARLSAIGCDEIQLELLKLLPGTVMRENSDIIYSPIPPYEVLQTKWSSYSEIQESRRLSRVIDLYYNCPSWHKTAKELIASDENFLKNFTQHLTNIELADTPLSQERRGTILYEYCLKNNLNTLNTLCIDWLNAGLSLKKGVGEMAEVFKGDAPENLMKGGVNSRTYRLKTPISTIWALYDKGISLTSPIDIYVENY